MNKNNFHRFIKQFVAFLQKNLKKILNFDIILLNTFLYWSNQMRITSVHTNFRTFSNWIIFISSKDQRINFYDVLNISPNRWVHSELFKTMFFFIFVTVSIMEIIKGLINLPIWQRRLMDLMFIFCK